MSEAYRAMIEHAKELKNRDDGYLTELEATCLNDVALLNPSGTCSLPEHAAYRSLLDIIERKIEAAELAAKAERIIAEE